MPNIKQIMHKYLYRISFLMVIIILFSATFIMAIHEQRQSMVSSNGIFTQVEQLLSENQTELTELKIEYSQACLKNAETIAYIIEHNPTVLESIPELHKIAEFVGVDEIHIFDKTGRIFTGTHPEYYNYTFDSGEQIGFFKPMLKDKSLKLCQDIMPNTAEEKPVQYSALWSENGEFIVQVGMEPVNVLRVTEKNELSYIFSLLKATVGVNLYAIDSATGEIIGSTAAEDVGRQFIELGFHPTKEIQDGTAYHAAIKGVNSFCMFTTFDSNYICRVVSTDMLYHNIPTFVFVLAICLIAIAIILVNVVTFCMNRYVIRGIYNVNSKLQAITAGNLSEKIEPQKSKEFTELATHINEMIDSLLASTDKISYVINHTHMRIGVYEYNKNMQSVRFTEYIPSILCLDSVNTRLFAQNSQLFNEYLNQLRSNPLPDEEGIFCLITDTIHYIRLAEVTDNNNVLGVVIDVTKDVLNRQKIKVERDVDLLTGLYNRRGLENQLTELFKEPGYLGYGVLIMIDADGLKEINDKYGHEKGDIYLKEIAKTIEYFGMRSRVAARQGGDEFVLFLYHYSSEEEVLNDLAKLEHIQNNNTAVLDDNTTVALRFSYGYSLTKGHWDYQMLLSEADEKMYQNKRERKSKIN